MKEGPDISAIAALLGDPTRAGMMIALTANPALTAGELAREAGVTAQTASSHLAKLVGGGLIEGRKQGRHIYYVLSGADVAEVIEALGGLAARTGHIRTRAGPTAPELRRARVCYDHLAGDLGVGLLDGLAARRLIVESGENLTLSSDGETFMIALGLDVAALSRGRRPLCKGCLDWSVRRSHLAGALGAALLQRFYALGWARREAGSRVVTFSSRGLGAFSEIFGLGRADAAEGAAGETGPR